MTEKGPARERKDRTTFFETVNNTSIVRRGSGRKGSGRFFVLSNSDRNIRDDGTKVFYTLIVVQTNPAWKCPVPAFFF